MDSNGNDMYNYPGFRNGSEISDNIVKIITRRENSNNWKMYLVGIMIIILAIKVFFSIPNIDTIYVVGVSLLVLVLILYFIYKSNNNKKLISHNFEYKYATVARMYVYAGRRYAIDTTDNETYLIDITINKFNPGEKVICIKYSPATIKVYRANW